MRNIIPLEKAKSLTLRLDNREGGRGGKEQSVRAHRCVQEIRTFEIPWRKGRK